MPDNFDIVRDVCRFAPFKRDDNSRDNPIGNQDKAAIYANADRTEVAGWSDSAGCWLIFRAYAGDYVYYGRSMFIGTMRDVA